MSETQIPKPNNDFDIREDHHSSFVREFAAIPKEPVTGLYKTAEVKSGRHIDASYPTRVISVRLRWQWDERKQAWWGSVFETVELLNPRTNERCRSGWKSEPIRSDYASRNSAPRPRYFDELLELTNPRTTITVTETAASFLDDVEASHGTE